MLHEDNSSTNEQFQIAQEAATKRTKEVVQIQKDFQTNIEEIHEDYLKRIENAKRKSDVEVDKLKKEVESKENDIGSKIANALKELTQEMKTREVKQNEALRSALKTLARKPNGAVEKDDMKEIKELISKSDDLSEIKELISNPRKDPSTATPKDLIIYTKEELLQQRTELMSKIYTMRAKSIKLDSLIQKEHHKLKESSKELDLLKHKLQINSTKRPPKQLHISVTLCHKFGYSIENLIDMDVLKSQMEAFSNDAQQLQRPRE